MRSTAIPTLIGLALAATLTACGGNDGASADSTSFALTDPQASATGTGDQAGEVVPVNVVDVNSAQVTVE